MKSKANTNISQVVKDNLCTQCGICVGICPTDAIYLHNHDRKGLIPLVNEELCTDCGICMKACPGWEVNFEALNEQLFATQPNDTFIGNYLEILSGYSNDKEVRYRGASGGIVTAILLDMIETGRAQGAVVVKMSNTHPLEPEILIARNRKEIIAAQQSKYLPVPLGIVLKEILKNNEKYALVTLPCHTHGLRKYENIKSALKEKIVLNIGLLCGFNPTLSSTKFLLRRAGVNNFNDIYEIKYRDGDWPCGFRAYMKDGSDHFLHGVERFLHAHYLFERRRCAICCDQMNEFADISVGDEWRLDDRGDKAGWCYVIPRTAIGKQILDDLKKRKIITLEMCQKKDLMDGNRPTLIFKKKGARAMMNVRKLFGFKIPNYNMPKRKLNIHHYLGALLVLVVSTFAEMKFFNRILLKASDKILTYYRYLVLTIFQK